MTLPDGSPFDLTGHVALVTGGNSGIGLGMADALAAHGADVAIWGTNPDKNDAAIEQLGRYDVELLSIVCDVGDEAAVIQAMADTVGELGRIDSCFVNAGVGGQAPSFVGMTSEEWRRVTRVNLDGAFFTAREAARHMVERHEDGDEAGGSIVFTTSGSAVLRPAVRPALRRVEGRGQLDDEGDRGRSTPATASGATRSCRGGSRAT